MAVINRMADFAGDMAAWRRDLHGIPELDFDLFETAAYVAALAFGAATSGLRMAFGGHFFTDVAGAGLVTFFVIWLMYGYIYRWPSTRLSDARIDAALTRLAWPGYRMTRKWFGRDVGPPPSA